MQEAQEIQVWSPGQEDPLKKGRAAHSSTLARRIPQIEVPGRLQSTGSQRVGHPLSTANTLLPSLRRSQKPRFLCTFFFFNNDFPGGSAGKESTCNTGDLCLLPELGRSPVEGDVYPLQYSGLENSMDCIIYGVAKSWTQLSDFHSHRAQHPLLPSLKRSQKPRFLCTFLFLNVSD